MGSKYARLDLEQEVHKLLVKYRKGHDEYGKPADGELIKDSNKTGRDRVSVASGGFGKGR